MVSKWLLRLVRGRVRTAVTLAVLPLAIMNGLPLAAGCVCADGHYEPVCHAGLCRAEKGDCGCSCCAHHSCCKGATACRRQCPAPLKDDTLGKRIAGNPCCTPVVHEAIPTVVTMPVVIDVHQLSALTVAAVDMPFSAPVAKLAFGADFDTGRPPSDLVVTLHRLVI